MAITIIVENNKKMYAYNGAHFSGKTIYSELTAPTDSPVKFCLSSTASDRAYTKEKKKKRKKEKIVNYPSSKDDEFQRA